MTLFRGYGGDLPLMRWLEEKIWPVEAKLDAEDVYWGTRLACAEMIRTGTARFWDMYWQPEATARAVEDAGLRATIGGPLFDADGRTAEAQARAQRRASTRWPSAARRIDAALAPHSIYTVSEELLRWAGEQAAERGLALQIHLSETEGEVTDCLAAHGERPAAYLDRLGLLGERTVLAHGVWLDRGGAGADRGARRHRGRQPGRQHEAGGRRRLPLPGGAPGRGRGRARHRRRRLQRLARPALRPEDLRPDPAPRRRRRDRRSRPPRRWRSRPAPARRCSAAAPSRSPPARRPTSCCCAATRRSSASATSPPTSSTRRAARSSTRPSSPAGC